MQGGVLGVLQTGENYLINGNGMVVLKAISNKIAEMGYDLFACVNPDHILSRKMFENTG